MSRDRERASRVFIGRLPHRADKRDIEKFFKGYGRIQDIHLKLGYAFIEFEDYRDADDAVHDLNNKDLLGDRVTVEHARPSRSSGGYRSGGSGYDRDRRDSRDYGSRSGGSGFTFRDKYGSPYNTEWRVIVENLSTRASWQHLKDYMRQVGDVTFSECHKQRAGEGVVEYACEDDMKRAIRKLDGTELMGKRIKLSEGKGGVSGGRRRSRSPKRMKRSRSRSPRRSKSPSPRKSKSASPSPRRTSRSPRKNSQSPRKDSGSPRKDSRSPGKDNRSPRKDSRSPRKDSRSPRKDSRSPRKDSRSPRKDSQSPRKSSRSPRKDSCSPRRSTSPRKNDGDAD